LKTIRESIGRPMRWRRTRLLPAAFVLRIGDEALATLAWHGLFGRSARAAAAEGEWSFRRSSLFSWSVLIEDAATGAELGRYSPGARAGTLRLADDTAYRIGRDGLFGPLRVWRENGGTLITFSRRPLFGSAMQLEAAASAEPWLGLLSAFAFYLLVLRRRRAASSSGG
jgi:hypothetical protein